MLFHHYGSRDRRQIGVVFEFYFRADVGTLHAVRFFPFEDHEALVSFWASQLGEEIHDAAMAIVDGIPNGSDDGERFGPDQGRRSSHRAMNDTVAVAAHAELHMHPFACLERHVI
ncbi:hypothetical protein V6N13_015586 [Hibiscus sabdariffa]|uniref:Uncharacterized protein n=1 Tax=Hibiscus sabdariffa TaxID=183260 RepID=A0ABR2CWF1_9ROSI